MSDKNNNNETRGEEHASTSDITSSGDETGPEYNDSETYQSGTYYTERHEGITGLDNDDDDDDFAEDKNRLHELIDVKYWEEVMKVLKHPKEKLMASIPFPGRHGDYPLHVVCDFVDLVDGSITTSNEEVGVIVFQPPPPELIKELILTFPEATKRRGQGGCLPLHLAAKRKLPKEAIELLIRAFPPALDVLDSFGYAPRDYIHNDIVISAMLDRPVSCWYQQIKDDRIADSMQKEMDDLEVEVNELAREVNVSLKEEKHITAQLLSIEEEVGVLTRYSHGTDIESSLSKFEKEFNAEIKDVSDRLTNLFVAMQNQNFNNLRESNYMKDFNKDIMTLHEDLDSCIDFYKKGIEQVKISV